MGALRRPLVEIELDFWGIIEPLLPLLEEIDRIEAIAAGKTEADDLTTDGQEEGDQGPGGYGQHDARVEGWWASQRQGWPGGDQPEAGGGDCPEQGQEGKQARPQA